MVPIKSPRFFLPYWALLVATSLLVGCLSQPETQANSNVSRQTSPIDWVDPFIGTDGKGKTYPGATAPYGMVQLSPDNGRAGWDWISGYFYPDNVIAGFSHKHLSGTGAGDLYDISFMPLSGKVVKRALEGGPEEGTISSTFNHDNEQAKPGYYEVYLDDYNITVSLTASDRIGIQRYRFKEPKKTNRVKLDLGYSRNWDDTTDTYIEIVDNFTVRGYRKSTGWATDQRVYFYTRFSQPFTQHQINEQRPNTITSAQGKGVAAIFNFPNTQELEVSTALSSVSMDNARSNWIAEEDANNFSATRINTQRRWNKLLSTIDVDASDDNKKQFYTALYHTYLAPRLFSDNDQRYKGPDGDVHTTSSTRFDFFSLWDTFRALHPFKTITDQATTKVMMNSMMEHYEVAGRLPVWIFEGNETDMMMGYHSVPVLIDAYLKGLTDIDGERLLQAAIESAKQQDFGIGSYQNLGYVPYEEKSWNVSLTLEYAFDDYAIALLAESLGKPQIAEEFYARAQNYSHHFDPKTGFMRAKSLSGTFRPDFDPTAYHPEDYCEANAWQYSFFVPHDIEGMIALYGGEASFANKLDAMFETSQSSDDLPEWISGNIGQYVHGNEPSHHVPYLYQYANAPHKTQRLVRKIMDTLYTTKPDGLAGNEDAGQMSAWYLFSAMGFYPVNPVSGEYVLGSPELNSAVIHLENGNEFKINTINQAPENVYVKQVSLNGIPLSRFTIKHSEIMAGGTLVFEMSNAP